MHGFYENLIGIHMHSIKCLCCQWPWVTPNHPNFHMFGLL